jgi:hypothetical protein
MHSTELLTALQWWPIWIGVWIHYYLDRNALHIYCPVRTFIDVSTDSQKRINFENIILIGH